MILEFISIKSDTKNYIKISTNCDSCLYSDIKFFIYPEIYSSAALYATLYIFLELIGPI